MLFVNGVAPPFASRGTESDGLACQGLGKDMLATSEALDKVGPLPASCHCKQVLIGGPENPRLSAKKRCLRYLPPGWGFLSHHAMKWEGLFQGLYPVVPMR